MSPELVDYVFMGQVLQAGAGQITARQAAVNAGIPMTVPATTVNKVCLSGVNTIHLADLAHPGGRGRHRGGRRHGVDDQRPVPAAGRPRRVTASVTSSVVDSMMYDGLFCAFDQCAMGAGTEKYAASAGLDRELAGPGGLPVARAGRPGHQGRAVSTTRSSPSRCPSARGDPGGGGPRTRGCAAETATESLASLRPAFDKAGNITAGNASQISDGGAAVVVMSRAKADELGVTPLGEIVGRRRIRGRRRPACHWRSRVTLMPIGLMRATEVHHHGLGLEVGVGAEDDLLDGLQARCGRGARARAAGRSDAVDGTDRSLQHVVAAPVLAGLLDRDDVERLLDHTDDRCLHDGGSVQMPHFVALPRC